MTGGDFIWEMFLMLMLPLTMTADGVNSSSLTTGLSRAISALIIRREQAEERFRAESAGTERLSSLRKMRRTECGDWNLTEYI